MTPGNRYVHGHNRRTMPAADRFWSKVKKGTGCWRWLGRPANDTGYGVFGVQQGGRSKFTSAHRMAYQLARGSIPAGAFVMHTCDNRLCVNPDHLMIGSPQDNASDMAHKDRSTFGERNPRAILKEAEVVSIRRLYGRGGPTQRELSERFGVSIGAIQAVL